MKKVQNLMPLSFVILGALLTWYSISMTAPSTSGQMMIRSQHDEQEHELDDGIRYDVL